MKIVLILLFAWLLPGCTSEPAPTTEPAATAGSAAAHLQRDKTLSPQAEDLAVRLLPEPQTVTAPVRAMVSGCRESSVYHWQVNDIRVEGVTGDRLDIRHFKRGDQIRLEVQCADRTVAVTGQVANAPPRVTAVRFADPEIIAGQDITVIPSAVDGEGDTLTFSYNWIINGEPQLSATSETLPGEYVHTGDNISLSVIPFDGYDQGPAFSGEAFLVPNSRPRFISTPPLSFQANNYEYQIQTTDPDGDTVTYRLEKAPPGMTLDQKTATLQWPLDKVAPGEYTVTVVAEDSLGQQARQEYSITLRDREPGR